MNFLKIYFNIPKNRIRTLCTVKNINPQNADSMPVSEYPPSKENYRRIFVSGLLNTGALGIPFSDKEKSKKDLKKLLLVKSPKRISFGEKFEVTNVAAGFGFSLFAVRNDSHQVYGCGINTDSQIGQHVIRDKHPLEIVFVPKPVTLPLIKTNTKVIKLSAGRAHSLILTTEGLFTLGNNAYGQCGRPIVADEDYMKSNFIHHISDIDGKNIIDVECGQDHSLLIANDGSVYSCGWSADGQTGLAHFRNAEQFTRVCGDVKGEKIVKLASRSDFVLALNDKGEVFGWGNVEYGQIKLPDNEQQLHTPRYLKHLNNLGRIRDIGAGRSACIVVNENGDVFTWGYGILGAGPKAEQSNEPLHIPPTLFGRNGFQPDNEVQRVVCGMSHMFALTNQGDVYAWGVNKGGCLALGTDKFQYFPLKVSFGGLAVDVATGVDHTIILCKPFI